MPVLVPVLVLVNEDEVVGTMANGLVESDTDVESMVVTVLESSTFVVTEESEAEGVESVVPTGVIAEVVPVTTAEEGTKVVGTPVTTGALVVTSATTADAVCVPNLRLTTRITSSSVYVPGRSGS